jgi:hypothetical protein
MGSKTERKRSGGRGRPNHIDHLRMDARYHRERRDLYRAKTYGPRATTPERLRELERAYEQAAERLQAAEARAKAEAVDGTERERGAP